MEAKNLAVGQTWVRNDGSHVHLVDAKTTDGGRLTWKGDDGAWYDASGQATHSSAYGLLYQIPAPIEVKPASSADEPASSADEPLFPTAGPVRVGQEWLTNLRQTVRITGVEALSRPGKPPKRWFVGSDGGRYDSYGSAYKGDVRLLERLRCASESPAQDTPKGLPIFAPAILDAAAGHMRDRAATYDSPEGERSMAKTVAVFNQFHGTAITEAQGWHFMQILKDVRLFTREQFHRDSGEDGVAYAALKVEAKAQEGGVS